MGGRRARTAVVAFATLLVACGYVQSGRWEDAPENWSRAFGSGKPTNVHVLHSYCWRAPHFTYEGGYFFAVRDAGGFRKEFISRNKLARLAPDEAAGARETFFGSVPNWFVPKPPDRYEVWVYQDEPRGNFKVFIDKDDGMVFLADYQA